MQILVGTGLYQNRFSSGLKQWIRKKNQIKNVILLLLYITYLCEIIPLMVVIAIDESTKCASGNHVVFVGKTAFVCFFF